MIEGLEMVAGKAAPWWLRLLPYLAVLALVCATHFAAYMHGADTTQEKANAAMSDVRKNIAEQNAAHALQLVAALRKASDQERDFAQQMAYIDQQHQKEIHENQIASQRVIAGLRDGTVSLRDKFTSCKRSADSGSAQAGASTCGGDGPASVQLQAEDAEFLILVAQDADRVADQLRACQAIVRSDRAQP